LIFTMAERSIMIRPPSILLFERLYLAAFFVSVVFAILTWSANVAALPAISTIASAKGAAGMLNVAYAIARGFVWAGWLLLLYLIGRRRSRVAKVVATLGALVAAWDGAGVLLAALSTPISGWVVTASMIEAALIVCAVAMLYRADARAWFAEQAA
jgi:hypothetical protein